LLTEVSTRLNYYNLMIITFLVEIKLEPQESVQNSPAGRLEHDDWMACDDDPDHYDHPSPSNGQTDEMKPVDCEPMAAGSAKRKR
ncbi:hypothetical protein, partial [Pseudomonas aeruginosa]|uniref:hypothetical protein n=1 Tax=Pseudomonas aeruginosa TaxID=287 RepID=UPI00397A26AC